MEENAERSELEARLPVYQRHDFEVLLSEMGWPIGIDSDYPAELRRRLHAASASYQMGNKSVDHVLKRYLVDVNFDEASTDRLDKKIAWFLTARLEALND